MFFLLSFPFLLFAHMRAHVCGDSAWMRSSHWPPHAHETAQVGGKYPAALSSSFFFPPFPYPFSHHPHASWLSWVHAQLSPFFFSFRFLLLFFFFLRVNDSLSFSFFLLFPLFTAGNDVRPHSAWHLRGALCGLMRPRVVREAWHCRECRHHSDLFVFVPIPIFETCNTLTTLFFFFFV